MTRTIEGISIPDSKLAREVTELVRDTESPLLFDHSNRVYYFGALAGKHRGLKFGHPVSIQAGQADPRITLQKLPRPKAGSLSASTSALTLPNVVSGLCFIPS